MELWHSPLGDFRLGRFPYDREAGTLRAWNGADTLLADHLNTFAAGRKLKALLVNDAFGALACASLAGGHQVRSQGDSWLSRLAGAENLRRHGLDAARCALVDSLSLPTSPDWQPDLVLLQIPKSNLLLEFQLGLLAACLAPGTAIAAGGMTRDIHLSTIELFSRLIGPASTSLAAHKARLIHCNLSIQSAAPTGRPSDGWPRRRPLAEPGLPTLELANHAGVFSASGHDRGSLLLLRHLADSPPLAGAEPIIIDCGCGNGLLALVAARLCPQAHLVCADESYMAVESARAGFAQNGLAGRASFVWTDALEEVETGSASLVLCNPPFHQGQSQTLAIALRMFADARRCLAADGHLLVVANRHLGHQRSLERWFSRVRIVADDGRFLVIEAS